MRSEKKQRKGGDEGGRRGRDEERRGGREKLRVDEGRKKSKRMRTEGLSSKGEEMRGWWRMEERVKSAG